MSAYELVRCFGVTVIPVPDLCRPAVYVRECQVALVDPSLTEAGAEACADWLLSAALRDLAQAV